jgi:biopolymer transport protein ExbD
MLPSAAARRAVVSSNHFFSGAAPMPLRSQSEEMPVLNLTSMIDVLFLLIIFFVVGTRFIEAERQIELKLPQVAPSDTLTAAPEKKLVNVYRDGQITLERKGVSLDELREQLAAARGQYRALGVLVRGDGAVPFERVANVLNACKQAGIAELAISVEIAGADKKHARR